MRRATSPMRSRAWSRRHRGDNCVPLISKAGRRQAARLPRTALDGRPILLHVESRADLAFVGGRIEPIASRRQPADAVAVRNGRIVAVGTAAEIREWIGRTTE